MDLLGGGEEVWLPWELLSSRDGETGGVGQADFQEWPSTVWRRKLPEGTGRAADRAGRDGTSVIVGRSGGKGYQSLIPKLRENIFNISPDLFSSCF